MQTMTSVEADTSKNTTAIPIHLHLSKVAPKRPTEFSPFSLHMENSAGIKDSLNMRSRRSRDRLYELSRGGAEDDGICTMRAESHLEANGVLQNMNLKKTPTTQRSVAQNAQGGSIRAHGSKGEVGNMPAKIILVAPHGPQ